MGLRGRLYTFSLFLALKTFVFVSLVFRVGKFLGRKRGEASFLINFHPFLTELLAIAFSRTNRALSECSHHK
jgi:hypothetical protein